MEFSLVLPVQFYYCDTFRDTAFSHTITVGPFTCQSCHLILYNRWMRPLCIYFCTICTNTVPSATAEEIQGLTSNPENFLFRGHRKCADSVHLSVV